MMTRTTKLLILLMSLFGCALLLVTQRASAVANSELDVQLTAVLVQNEFTGRIGSTLEQRLGRKVDHQLADLGRLLFFDTVGGLNNDNNCSGCHSPTAGFGDTQSIAIGVEN